MKRFAISVPMSVIIEDADPVSSYFSKDEFLDDVDFESTSCMKGFNSLLFIVLCRI